MVKQHTILGLLTTQLVIGVTGLLTLTACGQKGNLYLPSEPAATGQASLPQAAVRAVLPSSAASAVRVKPLLTD